MSYVDQEFFESRVTTIAGSAPQVGVQLAIYYFLIMNFILSLLACIILYHYVYSMPSSANQRILLVLWCGSSELDMFQFLFKYVYLFVLTFYLTITSSHKSYHFSMHIRGSPEPCLITFTSFNQLLYAWHAPLCFYICVQWFIFE